MPKFCLHISAPGYPRLRNLKTQDLAEALEDYSSSICPKIDLQTLKHYLYLEMYMYIIVISLIRRLALDFVAASRTFERCQHKL